MEEPLGILKRLCSHVTGITDETTLSEQYRVSVGVLRSGLWSGSSVQGGRSTEEARAVGERVKKWLIRHDRLQHAVNFSQLLNNVMNSSVLKNKASILTLLLLLGQESEHQQPHPSNVQNNSVGDGGDFFTLPPLYLGGAAPDSRGSSRATTGSSRSGSGASAPTSEGDSLSDGRGSVTARTAPTRAAMLATYCRGRGETKSAAGSVKLPGGSERQATQQPHVTRPPASQVEVTEEVLVREVLFVLQGIEGKIIKYDIAADGYRIDPKVRISKPVRDLILKLSEVGWLYSQVQKFCEGQQSRGGVLNKSASVGNMSAAGALGHLTQSMSYNALSSFQLPSGAILDPAAGRPAEDRANSASNFSSGPTLVNQALVLALRDHLNEHCRLIAVLEAQRVHGNGVQISYPIIAHPLDLRKMTKVCYTRRKDSVSTASSEAPVWCTTAAASTGQLRAGLHGLCLALALNIADF
ncbi:Gamma-tubulin complex component protein [Trinorchestia longiramus]|nr:Gamma-tubulin complex component protein [Trinorchestia longiramus]